MAMFTAEFEFKVDRKGRISVPADYRSTLAHDSYSGIVLIPVEGERALDGFGNERLESLAEALDDPDLYDDEDELELAKQYFAKARRIPFDGDGRIVLPVEIRKHAGITDAAIYVGGGNTFRLWHPTAYEAHKERLEAKARTRVKPVPLRLKPRKRKPEAEQ
ncbi:MAG: division/cell wall cluster transcriptional repressor MraZ [Rhodospirillales bacterium]|nr:division/cell wall cluster transcriptional repressor MraZ [Rhodospirillales bacterium]